MAKSQTIPFKPITDDGTKQDRRTGAGARRTTLSDLSTGASTACRRADGAAQRNGVACNASMLSSRRTASPEQAGDITRTGERRKSVKAGANSRQGGDKKTKREKHDCENVLRDAPRPHEAGAFPCNLNQSDINHFG
jgi:hypothetical protein